MVENLGCCGLLETCCHRHDPQKYIIEGTFEIDHSPWLSLCATGLAVAVRLHSRDEVDPSTGKGIESENAYIMNGKVSQRKKHTIKCTDVATRVIKFKLKFEVAQDFGIPGAFVVENGDKHEFFLKSAALRYINNPGFPEKESFNFYCASWVYPITKTGIRRIFFTDQLYLPQDTPNGLVELRQRELEKLRRGSKDERKPWDRIYEYDCYNDLGDPDNGRQLARPVLGDSTQYPYPRRLKTGRPPCHNDHLAESRPTSCCGIYVPPDERLSHNKQEELKDNFIDALIRFLMPNSNHPPMLNKKCPDFFLKIGHFFVPKEAISMENFRFIQPLVDFFTRKPKPSPHQDPASSDAIEMILQNIFADKQVTELEEPVKQKLQELVPSEIFNQVVVTAAATKGQSVSSQLPSIISENTYAWFDDNEFGRQMLAGTNPVRIRRLSDKDLSVLRKNNWPRADLDRLEKAMSDNEKLFILDHHDYLEPFLKMINGKGVCAYATRTILNVEAVGSTNETIIPALIELSIPDDFDGDSRLLSTDDNLWDLAKIHVASNDAAYHQLVSHWLHTHAIVEPFIIGTRRQLSVMHPIHRLLDPHFKDTLHINALARAIFLNAGGILETILFTGEFSMRVSSHLYKQWRFDEQALPTDLLKRGMATEKPKEKESSIKDENVSSEIIKMPAKAEEAKADDIVEPVEIDANPREIDEDVVELDDNPVITDTTEQPPDNKFDAGVNLVLEDYPYAKDGLEIWVAIETWVKDYCNIFYKQDRDVKYDKEIQAWWSEIRTVGHVDQKQGWYDIESLENLVKALTTLIWITTGLHAAVNFGQYGYNGWPLNRPMLLRKFVPRENTTEMDELEKDADKFLNQMLPEKFQMEFAIAVMDVLSRHTSDEVYLGQTSHGIDKKEEELFKDEIREMKEKLLKYKLREIEEKLLKREIEEKLLKREIEEKLLKREIEEKFKNKLREIEGNIKKRNKEYSLMNRWGYTKIPYKLLYPDTSKKHAKIKGERET